MDMHMAHQGLEAFRQAMARKAYDLIILDEINIAIYFGLIEMSELMEVVQNKPPELHLVLTGRNARKEVIEIADLVTEMTEIKHHFNQGINAQKGIEF